MVMSAKKGYFIYVKQYSDWKVVVTSGGKWVYVLLRVKLQVSLLVEDPTSPRKVLTAIGPEVEQYCKRFSLRRIIKGTSLTLK